MRTIVIPGYNLCFSTSVSMNSWSRLLKKRITDGMPVFSTSNAIPGHILLLEQHFLTRFPIHICWAEIFLFKPDDKMKPSQYFSHMIQKINEAELLQTPVHDIMTSFFLATNCPAPQLRLELLCSDYVSLNGMVNRAVTYKQAQSNFRKPTEEVNAVQARKSSQCQQGKRNKQPPANANKGIGQLVRHVNAVVFCSVLIYFNVESQV